MMSIHGFASQSALPQVRDVSSDLESSINAIFSPEEVKYAFLTGSFTLGTIGSDIDTVVVLNNNHLDFDKVKRFVDTYMMVHDKYGCKPDRDFPSDIVTPHQIENTINGRGFDIDSGNLYLRNIDSPEAFLDPDLDYRVYLWELISSQDGFICGNMMDFREDQYDAMRTIINYTMLNKESMSLDDLSREIFTTTGMDSKYHALSEDCRDVIKSCYDPNIFKVYNSELVVNEQRKLRKWEKSVIQRKYSGEFNARPVFGSWQALRRYIE